MVRWLDDTTAVFSVVTQRSPKGGALRDDTKNTFDHPPPPQTNLGGGGGEFNRDGGPI